MATQLTPSEAKPRLTDFHVIVDVRSQKEWDGGHLTLPSVVHLEHTNPDTVAELEPSRNQKVLVHCEMGKRAGVVAKLLAEAGFSEVFVVVDGGYSKLV